MRLELYILMLLLIVTHVAAAVICSDARSTKGAVLTGVSAAILATTFYVVPSRSFTLEYELRLGAMVSLFYGAALAACYGAGHTGAIAASERLDPKRGVLMKRASRALLAVASADLLLAIMGSVLLAFTVRRFIPV